MPSQTLADTQDFAGQVQVRKWNFSRRDITLPTNEQIPWKPDTWKMIHFLKEMVPFQRWAMFIFPNKRSFKVEKQSILSIYLAVRICWLLYDFVQTTQGECVFSASPFKWVATESTSISTSWSQTYEPYIKFRSTRISSINPNSNKPLSFHSSEQNVISVAFVLSASDSYVTQTRLMGKLQLFSLPPKLL